MGISDMIAGYILSELALTGSVELQRAELAMRFHCVPSQINYVISTRFTPEHGYIVESKRGGNGYIKISRVAAPKNQLIMHMVNSIGFVIDHHTAEAFISNALGAEVISERDALLMRAAISHNALLPMLPYERDAVRASILKTMLINSIKGGHNDDMPELR